MTKSKLDLIVDALLFLCITAIGGIGFLMKYVLVPGYQRWEIYKRNVNLYLCGMDRHEWGEIHLTVACVFFGLLILHIALHWGIIIGIYRKLIPNHFARFLIALVLICSAMVLLLFPVFVNPEIRQGGCGCIREWQRQESSIYPLR